MSSAQDKIEQMRRNQPPVPPEAESDRQRGKVQRRPQNGYQLRRPPAQLTREKRPAGSSLDDRPITGFVAHERDGPGGCGHVDQFAVIEGETFDRAAHRLKGWRTKPCHHCREQRQIRQVIAQERAAQDRRGPQKFRLPPGTRFLATYGTNSRGDDEWVVTLFVPGRPDQTAVGPALHPTVKKLGQEWFRKNGASVKKVS